MPGARAWGVPDAAAANRCLDGANQLPTEAELPGFREAVTSYFDACAELSRRLAVLMAKGIVANGEDDQLVRDLESDHTSYLRLNYYPVCDSDEVPPPLGISPHKDAGFLTVLLQDDDCHSLQVYKDGAWITHHPEPGAFTLNTGRRALAWRRFAVGHHLLSVTHNRRLRLRSFCPSDDEPVIDSVVGVWAAANWFEREAFDLFGILFNGHPDLRRILMWDGYKDHPMRKDYVEPDDYEYEPTPHDDVLEKTKKHIAATAAALKN